MPSEAKQFIAVYGRVSDADSLVDSSVPDQVCAARVFAQKKWADSPILEFVEIKTAATIRDRPVFMDLLSLAVEGKIKAIVVRDQDRLSRETGEMLALHRELTKHGVEVWTYGTGQQLRTDHPQEKAFLTLMATFSTLEREMAAVRTKARVTSMRNAGKWTGGNVPKGYDLAEVEGQKIFVPNPKAAPGVRRVFETAAGTKSLADAYSVSKALGLWTNKTGVQYALKNRVYLGEYKTSNGWLKDHHEPIVDETTFQLAQETVGRKWTSIPGQKKVDRVYLLAGIIRCGRTDKMLTPKHVKKKNGHRIYYYEHSRRPDNGPIVRLPAGKIEQAVWDALVDMCSNPRIIKAALTEADEMMSSSNSEALAEWQQLEGNLKEARKERDGLLAFIRKAIRSGQDPATSINQEIASLDGRIDRLGALTAEAKERAKPASALTAGEWVAALRRALSDGPTTPEARARVIRAIVQEVVIYDDDAEIVLKTGGSAIGSNERMDWLPELDLNQQPSG